VIAAPEALLAAESVPQAAPLHPDPLKVHDTPLFCASFTTVAVNVCVPLPLRTLAVVGATVTLMAAGAGVTVIAATADFVPSAADVAVKATAAGDGTLAGAV
jgi:hypothetical protein